jgi:acetyltransferase-like isoleucine patch superfamily enzyme
MSDDLTSQLRARYPQYEFGEGTYGNPEIQSWGEGATLRIGAYCSIAPGVKILLGGEHRTDWITTYPFSFLWPEGQGISGHPRTRGDVVIGNDVWLASDSLILSGVTIGDGAVIGARAVVTRNVPPYAFAAGVPAKVVGYRFDPETIEQLLQIRWWAWPRTKIAAELPLLCSGDVSGFIARHRPALRAPATVAGTAAFSAWVIKDVIKDGGS